MILGITASYIAYSLYFKTVHIRGMEDIGSEPIRVSRSQSGIYTLRFNSLSSEQPIKVYAGLSPNAIDESKPILETTENTARVLELDAKQRYYFKIIQTNATKSIISERLLNLEGTSNFRDIGGYFNQDGRQVKWAKIYRADQISNLKTKDWAYLKSVGLRTILDLRGPEEVNSKTYTLPSNYPTQRKSIPIYDPAQPMRAIIRMLRKADPNTFEGDQYMIKGYQQFTSTYKDCFAAVLQEISQADNQPVLIHCTGGKDRTGFAIALILGILGVPNDIIMQDYLASNYYRYYENRRIIRQAALFRISPKVITPILEVREAYLKAAWQAIEQNYDSLSHFLEQELGVKPSLCEKIREQLLD